MEWTIENALVLRPGHRFETDNVVVKDGRIAAVSPDAVSCGVRYDGRGKMVLPGLVNAHGHTPMTLVRGLGGGLPLKRWLEEAIFPVEAKMRPEDIAAGMTWGALEMLAGGTTCVADMYDFPEDGARALSATGMKGNLCRVGLAFATDVPPNRLAECIDFLGDKGPDGILRDICVHSEYLTNEKFCRELAVANRDFRRPVHVHASETLREHEECIARHGLTPIAYLASTGLFDYGGYVAHGVWCTDDDFRIMSERGVTVVHNPTSNMKLGSGFARIPRAAALGVNIALGTDGSASNDNLDMFEEMHLAALVHKGLAQDPTVLSAWDVIDFATVNGAHALGRDDCGEIAPDKCADFCVIDLDKPHLKPCLEPASLVVNSMHASDVVLTVANGEIVYDADSPSHWPRVNFAKASIAFDAAVARLGLRDLAQGETRL